VAGLGGDSGKTLLSLALLLRAREEGFPVAGFKKGPDYIDAAWLSWASGRPARNLDTHLMGFGGVLAAFGTHAARGGLSVIEGNRGLYDGLDARGSHSTAELAKALKAPVVLVVSTAKVTRTVAALVLGCRTLDGEVPFAGVVLNQVATARQERLVRQAVEAEAGLPVLGAIPRLPSSAVLPGRHLGLVTPAEHPSIGEVERTLRNEVWPHLDLDALRRAAAQAPPLPAPAVQVFAPSGGAGLRIGVVRDSAFTFYYPENLEALEGAGASLAFLSPLGGERFPEDLDALYIGGGFPETHAARLEGAASWFRGLRAAAEEGLPVYAECGGLMVLCRALRWDGRRYEMAGVLPAEVEVFPSPQGHGYAEIEVDRENAFYRPGLRLRGHEFHYSRVVEGSPETAAAVLRGSGALGRRDGLVYKGVWASYLHLHAAASPEWTNSLLSAARKFARLRKEGPFTL